MKFLIFFKKKWSESHLRKRRSPPPEFKTHLLRAWGHLFGCRKPDLPGMWEGQGVHVPQGFSQVLLEALIPWFLKKKKKREEARVMEGGRERDWLIPKTLNRYLNKGQCLGALVAEASVFYREDLRPNPWRGGGGGG